jgi:hypothetical protein
MLFSLTNTLATFQNYINNILAPYLDHFCTAYLDDILIYLDNFEEHQQYIQLVLDTFTMVGLYLKPEKCKFYHHEVKYLWLSICTEGIKMDPERIHAMHDWEAPSNLKDIRAFLGFANFYYRFLHNYSCMV